MSSWFCRLVQTLTGRFQSVMKILAGILALGMLVGCAPSAASLATAMAQTQAAATLTHRAISTPTPTLTPTPAATATWTPTRTPTPTSTFTLTPTKATTQLTLTTSPASPATFSQTVVFVAQVTTSDGSAATGTVTFVDANRRPIPFCPTPVQLSLGQATCSTSSLPIGPTAVGAEYSGDSLHSGSAATFVSFVMNKVHTSISISANSSYNGIPVWRYSASATVVNNTGGRSPDGTVALTWDDGAANRYTLNCTLDSNGQCSVIFTTSFLYYHVNATYNGTETFNSSTSSSVGTGR
jgi:hypothetical protein